MRLLISLIALLLASNAFAKDLTWEDVPQDVMPFYKLNPDCRLEKAKQYQVNPRVYNVSFQNEASGSIYVLPCSFTANQFGSLVIVRASDNVVRQLTFPSYSPETGPIGVAIAWNVAFLPGTNKFETVFLSRGYGDCGTAVTTKLESSDHMTTVEIRSQMCPIDLGSTDPSTWPLIYPFERR